MRYRKHNALSGYAKAFGKGHAMDIRNLTGSIVALSGPSHAEEVARFADALGANPQTVFGLSGMGDLVVTCTSRHSRNRSVGERLGKGERLADIVGSMKMVAEGVWNAQVVRAMAGELKVEMPITETVCRLCHEGLPAKEAISILMNRPMKGE